MPDQPELRWFHIIVTTYGTWLYGDPRGFRTRHHREHVEGDYKNPPPPGLYEGKAARSRESLKQEPVVLAPDWRAVVGAALRDRLLSLGGEVLAAAMAATHGHLLAKLPPDAARDWAGLAKKHAWFVARDHGWTGLLWAKRSKPEPIKDRGHHENTFHYIGRHAAEGAWVWTFREPITAPTPPSAQSPPVVTQSPPVATGGLAPLNSPDSPTPDEGQ